METVNSQAVFLYFVNFSQIKEWDVKRYANHSSHQFEKTFRLGDLLQPFKQRITHEQVIKDNLAIISKIDFSGNLHLRERSEIETYKGNVFLVPKNHLIYSKINVKHGCIYFNNQEDFVVSNEYPCFSFDTEKINGYFLILLLRSDYFKKLLNTKTNGIGKARVKSNEFLDLQIPLPDINTQKSLVQAYQEKMAKADELGKQANQIDNDIEHYLFEQLGIEIQQTPKAQIGKLRFVNFRDLNLWGVTSQNAITAETIFKSNQFKNEPITTFFEINPTTQIPKNQIISFIPMANISDIYGEISVHDKKTLKPNYTKFKENDLIWAKITPCMENGKSAVATNLENGFGFGSTEFHVLRARNNDFSIYLLHLLLRTKHLRKIATQYFTGSSGQQRVPKTFLETLTLPVLSLETQTQITNYIQVQKQRQKSYLATAAALRLGALTEFEQAIFSNKSNCFFVN